MLRIVSLAACLALAPAVALAGPPFLTDDPDPTPRHAYEVYTFAAGDWGGGGQGGDAGIDFNWGAGEDLLLTVAVPVLFDNPRDDGGTSGLGNIELAAKYRIAHQERSGWSAALFPRLFLPAGSHLGDRRASLLLPLWVGRGGENWSTFGGGGCAIHRGGDARDYCLAGWASTRKISKSLRLGGELFHQTADTEGGKPSTTLGAGATYDVNDTVHLLGYAGTGLQNRDQTGRGTWYASVLFTF